MPAKNSTDGNNGKQPVIRRRTPVSQRNRDGLLRFARDTTSQSGEDGIIARIFELLPPPERRPYWCVDVGAWDGKHLSNTFSLLVPSSNDGEGTHPPRTPKWRGILIETDAERFHELSVLHEPLGNICLHVAVSGTESPNSLANILSRVPDLPRQLDLLCIDIDGSDYWALHGVLESNMRPKVILVEFNPTMPNDLVFIPVRNDAMRHGASLSALVELAESFEYTLVETTLYNAFFVQTSLFQKYLRHEVPDTSVDALHEPTMTTSVYQLYDGTIKLWGCKKMLWHRIPVSRGLFHSNCFCSFVQQVESPSRY